MARVSLKSRNVSRRKASSKRTNENTSGEKERMVSKGLLNEPCYPVQEDVEYNTGFPRDEKESEHREDRDVGRSNEVLPTKEIDCFCGHSKGLHAQAYGGCISCSCERYSLEPPSFLRSIQLCWDKVRVMLTGRALSKGYRLRDLDDFMALFFHDHALGEIIYKAIRYQRKGDPEDLIKIAAWAFLLYDRTIRNQNENKQESPNKDRNEIS